MPHREVTLNLGGSPPWVEDGRCRWGLAGPPSSRRSREVSRAMMILHASASDGRLVLWGETSTVSPAKTSRKVARRVETVQAARSRFALDADRLAEAVTAEVSGFEPTKDQRQSWVAWLPSNDQGALPSSPLLTERTEGQGAVGVAPWEVPALALTTEQMVDVLVASTDRTTWGPGVVVGK